MVEKKKDGINKEKRYLIANVGVAMQQYGSELDQESAYGNSAVIK